MTTRSNQLQPRRSFVKALLYGLVLPGLWLARRFQERAAGLPEFAKPPTVIPYVPEPGIRFYDSAIVITSREGLSVFSSSCPHLGCRINQAEGEELVCPCHGSRFDKHGQLVRNPASRGLSPLKYEQDRKEGVLRIFPEAA